MLNEIKTFELITDKGVILISCSVDFNISTRLYCVYFYWWKHKFYEKIAYCSLNLLQTEKYFNELNFEEHKKSIIQSLNN